MHGIGTRPGWEPEGVCLHHCYELVRNGEWSATLGSLFPLPKTKTVAQETMTFSNGF